MTDYNIDFLIAGLVFLIFLLIHFQRYKKLNNISGVSAGRWRNGVREP